MGSVLGIVACVFGYLHGFMFVITNDANEYMEYIGVIGIITSYVLLPLCVLNFILAVLRACFSNPEEKRILGFKFLFINDIFIYLTVLFGFIGSRQYFILPAILLLLNKCSYKLSSEKTQEVEIDSENMYEDHSEDELDSVKVYGEQVYEDELDSEELYKEYMDQTTKEYLLKY
jgi:hypothetical protein